MRELRAGPAKPFFLEPAAIAESRGHADNLTVQWAKLALTANPNGRVLGDLALSASKIRYYADVRESLRTHSQPIFPGHIQVDICSLLEEPGTRNFLASRLQSFGELERKKHISLVRASDSDFNAIKHTARNFSCALELAGRITQPTTIYLGSEELEVIQLMLESISPESVRGKEPAQIQGLHRKTTELHLKVMNLLDTVAFHTQRFMPTKKRT